MKTYRFPYDTTGRMSVRFIQGQAGWIDMQLRVLEGNNITTERDADHDPIANVAEGATIYRRKLRMSAVFCPFPQMIAWLEAISRGLNHCSWQWDGEGVEYSLDWNLNALTIREEYRSEHSLRVRLAPRDLVAAIYRSFRRFAESNRYCPREWEDERYGEAFVEHEGSGLTQEELRGRLLTLSAAEVEHQLQGWLRQRVHVRGNVNKKCPWAYQGLDAKGKKVWLWPYVTKEWDAWTIAQRRSRLCDIFGWIRRGGYDGTPLGTLRSEIVERFLREE